MQSRRGLITFSKRFFYPTKPGAEVISKGRSWMKEIPGSKRLYELAVPGTHETCAVTGSEWHECQKWELPLQLAAGIRYIDIRCRLVGDTFEIHHGAVHQDKNFEQVLNDCENFLSSETSECIFMRIEKEYSDDVKNSHFRKVFREVYQAPRKDLWIDFTDKNTQLENAKNGEKIDSLPTLDEARGKIFLLSNTSGIGLAWSNMHYQDLYKRPTVEDKIKEIKKYFAEAKDHPYELGLNHFSAYSETHYPQRFSRETNDEVKNHHNFKGMMAFDYPLDDQILHVLKQN